jgi:MFS family permease
MLGIAADAALLVVTFVTVFNQGGVVAVGILGAIRMVPAVAAGMLAGWLLERVPGDRLLVGLGLVRAAAAAGTAIVIATAAGPGGSGSATATLLLLSLLSAVAAAAAAPIRPTDVTLMPAIARSPDELVAANTLWSTGEGIGAFLGPFVAGALMAVNLHPVAAAVASIAFLATSLIQLGLRFENVADASAGRHAGGRLRLLDGFRAVRGSRLLSWTMIGAFCQVITRGLLNALVVVAAIELLAMGQSGPGLLSAALGIGGLIGAMTAMSSSRPERLVRASLGALVFWGAPLVVVGLLPVPPIALAAMVVIGVANATYDVALFTILQRSSTNEMRAPVLSVLETVIGLGAVTGSLLAPVLVTTFGARGGLIVSGLFLPTIAVVIALRVGHVDRIAVVNEPTVQLLRQVPSFAALPMTAVERLADGLVPFSAAAGTYLMTQGEPGDRFVVIESGSVDIFVDGEKIDTQGPGAGLGEIALLRHGPRTATVVASTDVTGYGVGAPTFLAAVAGPSAAAVTERMARAHLERAHSVERGVPAVPTAEPET